MKSMLRVSGEDAIGESAPTGADRSPRALVDLLRFFELGRASDAADHHELSLLPVALAPYRDASRLKTSYPLLLPADGSPPLTMDELNSRICEALGVEGDERRRLEQLVARFELALRQLEREEPGDFVALAAEARASVVAAARVDDEKRGALSGTLQQAVATAVPVGTLLFDTPRVVEHLTQQIAAAHRRRVAGELVTELDELIERLESWLAADFAQSAEAMSPDHLKVSLGTKSDDEFDADALSSLLRGARERTPEQQRRHARIEEAYATLLKWAPLFRGAGVEGLPAELAGRLKSLVRAKHGDLAAALGAERELEELFVPFFRARRIARLEIDDVYREHAFDAYFASFGADQLDPSERRLCPPVVLTLRSEALTTTGLGALMKALGAGRPLNIVLEISALDRLDGAKEQATATALDFARMALLLPGVFVFQGSYSEPLALHAAFADALNWPGPSLVAVFTGFEAQQSAPSRYLTAAAALESRVLPTFVRRPQAGGGWAEQLSLAGNPHLEEQLSVEELALGGEEGATTAVAFTPADLYSLDPNFSAYFLPLDRARVHASMMPLDEFIALPAESRARVVPFLRMADASGEQWRVVVARPIVEIAERHLATWRALQELGGIDNSHVNARVAAETERLTAEKEREVASLRAEYQAQLEQQLGDLARSMMRRLAAGLLNRASEIGSATTSSVAPTALPARREGAAPAAAAPVSEAPAAAAAPPEEEDDIAPLSDPYIDTPLCTTCNECTNLNGKLFAYNTNKQAVIADPAAGTYRELVIAAEKCPVRIIHPGQPKNPDEPELEALIARAKAFN